MKNSSKNKRKRGTKKNPLTTNTNIEIKRLHLSSDIINKM